VAQVVVADWFIDLSRTRIAFKRALVCLAFPLTYAPYSLIRGHFTAWYPYPFFNPSERADIGVATTSSAIVLVATTVVWLLTRFTTWPIVKKEA